MQKEIKRRCELPSNFFGMGYEMVSKYGAIHCYEDADIEKWCKDSDWQAKMVE